jgi:hypothetical protein
LYETSDKKTTLSSVAQPRQIDLHSRGRVSCSKGVAQRYAAKREKKIQLKLPVSLRVRLAAGSHPSSSHLRM